MNIFRLLWGILLFTSASRELIKSVVLKCGVSLHHDFSGDHRLSSSSAWTLGCILVEGTCTLYKLFYVYVYILALLQAWSRTPFHQEVRNLPLQAWMVLRSMEVYTVYIHVLLTSTCIIVWLENVHVYPHRVWVCSKGTLSVIGASLSQPHTSVTSLRTRVCMFACLLACFFSCILCLSCYLFRPWVSLPTNPYPMLVAFQDPEIQLALNRLSPKPRPQTYSAQN